MPIAILLNIANARLTAARPVSFIGRVQVSGTNGLLFGIWVAVTILCGLGGWACACLSRIARTLERDRIVRASNAGLNATEFLP